MVDFSILSRLQRCALREHNLETRNLENSKPSKLETDSTYHLPSLLGPLV